MITAPTGTRHVGPTATAAVVDLRHDAAVPLHRQVSDCIRRAIVTSKLCAGTRLPSTRSLAESLGVSRNTIYYAYEELTAEGYLTAHVGSGTFVTASIPDDYMRTRITPRERQPESSPPRLSNRGKLMASLPVTRVSQGPSPRPFRCGVSNVDTYAWNIWLRLVSQTGRSVRSDVLGYGDPAGHWPLRKLIAEYVGASRAVECSAEQVLVVSGSQQALDLAARVLADPGDSVWIEDPARTGARSALLSAGLSLTPVPVDHDGLVVAEGVRRAPDAVLAYVSPSHQFPTGVRMSATRRLELLRWAAQTEAWIIEDDYDSDYLYAGASLPSLQGLDEATTTIYIGTFSRAIFPGLRMGYLIAPRPLVEAFTHAKALIDRQTSPWLQVTLARYIEDGYLARHLRRMRKIYARRRDMVIEAAQRHANGLLDIRAKQAGTHLVAGLPDGTDDEAAERRAARLGVETTAMSRFVLEQEQPPALLLGYTAGDEADIEPALTRLGRALADQCDRTAPFQPSTTNTASIQ